MSKAVVKKRDINELVKNISGDLNKLSEGQKVSLAAETAINKLYGMVLYIQDEKKFNDDYTKLGIVLAKLHINDKDRKLVNNMYRELAVMALNIRLAITEHKQDMALIQAGTELEKAVKGQEEAKVTQIIEQRKSWSQKEGVALGVAGVMASASTAGVAYLTSFAELAREGVGIAADWLQHPLGYCQEVTKEVIKQGWLGPYTESVKIKPDDMLCSTLDSLSGGMHAMAETAGYMKTGSLLLVFVVLFIVVYVIARIVGQRWSIGVNKIEMMGFGRRGKARRVSKAHKTKRRRRN